MKSSKEGSKPITPLLERGISNCEIPVFRDLGVTPEDSPSRERGQEFQIARFQFLKSWEATEKKIGHPVSADQECLVRYAEADQTAS